MLFRSPLHPLVEKLANAKDNASIYFVLKEYFSNPQHVRDIPDFKNQCFTKLRSLHLSGAAPSSVTPPSVTPRAAPPRVTPPSVTPRAEPSSAASSRVTPLSLVTRADYGDPDHPFAPGGNPQEQRERKRQQELLTKIFDSGWLDRQPKSDIERLVRHQHSMNEGMNEFLSNFTYNQEKLTEKNILKWVRTLTDKKDVKTNPVLLSLLADYTDYYAKLNSVIRRSPELSETIRALVTPSMDDLKNLGGVPKQEDITDEERSLFDPKNNPMIAHVMRRNSSVSSSSDENDFYNHRQIGRADV